jgi:hypothetical protein
MGKAVTIVRGAKKGLWADPQNGGGRILVLAAPTPDKIRKGSVWGEKRGAKKRGQAE